MIEIKHNSSEDMIKDLLIFTISISVTLTQHYVSDLLLVFLSSRMCTNDLLFIDSINARVCVQKGDRFVQVPLMSVNLFLHQSPLDNICLDFSYVSDFSFQSSMGLKSTAV